MKYAIWSLKIENENYLSGPEATIAEAGGSAEGAWCAGSIENGDPVLGYVFGDFEADLSAWNYREVTQEEALDFCQSINLSAKLQDNRIVV